MKIYIVILTLLFTCFLLQAQEFISGNCYDGFGRIKYDNGQEYIGEFKNGDPHGYGQTMYINNDMYIGEYNNGKKHGLGIILYKNGNKYLGSFENGKQEGYAIKYEGGTRLITEWDKGVLKKGGVKELKDKTGCLKGKCNKLDGFGISINPNGSVIIGNLTKALHAHNDIYIGELRGAERYGKGLVAYSGFTSGGTIEVQDKKSGSWISYYTNSRKKIFLRNWINDEMIEEIPINDVNTKISAPPSLIAEDLQFNDFNSNNLLEANEQATISFNLKNTGEGSAYGIIIQVNENNNTQGLIYDRNKQINILKPQSVNAITIPITASMSLETGQASFTIKISEGNGFDADPIDLSIETQSFISPNLEIVDYVFSSDDGVMRLGKTAKLQFAIQNLGQGIAEDIKINMQIPTNVFASDESYYAIDELNPGEKKLFDFSFFTNKRFSSDMLNITADISEKYKKYASDNTMSVKMEQDISNAQTLTIASNVIIKNINIEKFSLSSSVDKNIPDNRKLENRFALVIGNEDYASFQSELQKEQNVDYAVNDATVFERYALKTLGVKPENMFSITNATSGVMSKEIKKVIKLTELEGKDAELIIYYAGHGFPDDQKVPHLIPVDVSGGDLSRAINLPELYKDLGNLKAKKVTVFLDACFTGGGRNSGLVASRGIKVKPKEGSLGGSLVVFSASSGDQSSLPFNKEKHGVFTYHLLKALQDAEGDISYGSLYDAINIEVNKTTVRNQGMEQTPKVNTSSKVVKDWRNWKF